MKEGKYHIYLDDSEYSRVIQSLISLKNSLIEQGRCKAKQNAAKKSFRNMTLYDARFLLLIYGLNPIKLLKINPNGFCIFIRKLVIWKNREL